MKNQHLYLTLTFSFFFSFQIFAQTIFWSESSESGPVLKSRNLVSDEETVLFQHTSNNPDLKIVDITLDTINQKIFFQVRLDGNSLDGTLNSINYDGSNLESAFSCPLQFVNYHYEEKLLYHLSNEVFNNFLGCPVGHLVLSVDSTGQQTEIYTCEPNCAEISSLQLDENSRKLFFVETDQIGTSIIKKMNLDGSEIQDLPFSYESNFTRNIDFHLDPVNDAIYIKNINPIFTSDFNSYVIKTNELRTELDTILLVEGATAGAIASGFGDLFIDSRNEKLYFFWAESFIFPPQTNRYLIQCDLNGNNLDTIAINEFGSLDSWAIDPGASQNTSQEVTFTHYTSSYREVNNSMGDQSVPFNVCADGSAGSIIGIDFSENIDPENIILRIQEDPNNEDIDSYGSFINTPPTLNAINVIYQHPKYLGDIDFQFKSATIEVVDISNNQILSNFPLNIYRAPVLMIHGLWGNPSAFNTMKEELISSQKYYDFSLLPVDYESSNDSSFLYNHQKGVVRKHIDKALDKLLEQRISAGKVDIIGHSMGGILSRLYIQDTDYRYDVNKLITCNTPHFGSQFGNLIFDPGFRCNSQPLCAMYNALTRGKNSCYNGAISDLQVNGNAINLLNQNNSNEVYSHVVSSEETIINLISSNTEGDTELLAFITAISLGLTDDNFTTLFDNNTHDIIVAKVSQQGGLGVDFVSNTLNQWHLGSVANMNIIRDAKELLDANPTQGQFSQSGFGSSPSNFNYTPVDICDSEPQAEITVNSPTSGETFQFGDMIDIDVSGSGEFEKIIVYINHDEGGVIYRDEINSQAGNITYEVSNTLLGVRRIVVTGLDERGMISCLASLDITVDTDEVPTSIVSQEKSISIAHGGTHRVFLEADFEGRGIDISELDGVEFTFKSGNARRLEKNTIKGLNLGHDTLTVNYKGITSEEIPIHIFEESSSNPTSIDEYGHQHSSPEFKIAQIYPNPGQNDYTVNYYSPLNQDVKVRVYNLNGQTVFNSAFKSKEGGNLVKVSLPPKSPSGFYFVSILGEKVVRTAKIIKTH